MKYDVWALIDGEAVRYPSPTKDLGNAVFVELKKKGYAIATDNGQKIRFWNCIDHDWLEAFIVCKNEYCDWVSNDSFGIRILSQCEDWTCFHPEKGVSVIYINGKKYRIVEEFCREDDQLAYDYGLVDKYFRYTFYDMNGNKLSSYCTEA